MGKIGARKNKINGFHKSFLVTDGFKPRFTNDIAAAMLIGHTIVVKVLAGCTSKLQPLDAFMKKALQSIPLFIDLIIYLKLTNLQKCSIPIHIKLAIKIG